MKAAPFWWWKFSFIQFYVNYQMFSINVHQNLMLISQNDRTSVVRLFPNSGQVTKSLIFVCRRIVGWQFGLFSSYQCYYLSGGVVPLVHRLAKFGSVAHFTEWQFIKIWKLHPFGNENFLLFSIMSILDFVCWSIVCWQLASYPFLWISCLS